jgi:hypothetical protein
MASNTLLTPDDITREFLRVLHQKANFLTTIDTQYDDRFARDGAKIGDSLRIRNPVQYEVTTGKTLVAQDTTETSQTLQITTQKHVGMNFSMKEMTLDIQDFSERYIEPAASVLVASIEADAMSMYKDVYNSIWDDGNAIDYDDILDARVLLQNSLTPGGQRFANLSPKDTAELIKDTKSLFNNQTELGKQFLEGYIGRAAGFDFMENTLWPLHTAGGEDGAYVVNTSTGITSGSATIAVTGGTGTLAEGDVFTIVGVYTVHPETKQATTTLQQFVVASAYSGGNGNITVSPTPVTSGARQNVSIVGAGGGKSVVVAGTASGTTNVSMLYHKEAFTFATADLEMPDASVGFKSRKNKDGISLRVVRQYDINNDNMPCRVDVLYGYKALRPEFAARLHFN